MSEQLRPIHIEPTYCSVGFLQDLFEAWTGFEGTEWGDVMRSLVFCMHTDYCLDETEIVEIGRIAWKQIAFMWADRQFHEYYGEDIAPAQEKSREVRDYWIERAMSMGGGWEKSKIKASRDNNLLSYDGWGSFQRTLATIPHWVFGKDDIDPDELD